MDKTYENLQLQPEDYKFLAAIKLSILRGLVGEVIPSLRAVFLAWKPHDEVVTILFYHDGIITDAIQSHYSGIMTEVGGDCWEYMGTIVGDYFDIIRLDYPEPLPKIGYTTIAYERKEPFIDPK